LDKIFTQNEQLLIAAAEDQISWFGISGAGRKQPTKIYNRATGVAWLLSVEFSMCL
jgi:hypothetical protein